MKTKVIGIAAVIVIIIAVSLLLLAGQGGGQTASNSNNSTATAPILFASSQIASYSYLISVQNLSAEAQAALSGYAVQKVLEPDGSMNVTITINASGASQTVTIKPGYKLYVVETSFGDDSGRYDSSFADDGFVIVDPNGYIAG
ncbi:MAG: hypothetical protein KGI04_04840 [Candidatus Micrarchaeota archaeon]|nr:hypothetical protein [Candidatus Micrarchaeota archaeon]